MQKPPSHIKLPESPYTPSNAGNTASSASSTLLSTGTPPVARPTGTLNHSQSFSALSVSSEDFSPSPSPGINRVSQPRAGAENPAGNGGQLETPANTRQTGRLSFAQRQHRPSTASRATRLSRRIPNLLSPSEGVDPFSENPEDLEPKIPKLVGSLVHRAPTATKLPLLPMLCFAIAMMSEFLSANVSTPFILAMVREFPGMDPLSVGVWTGNLVSSFFITQFITSLLWSTIADRHGRRLVLVVSLIGSGITCMLFGTARSLPEALCIRLAQGVFGGAIGVVRGGIRDITDVTNEASAYAILGFCWGLGGVIGPVVGGVFESPAKNYPYSPFAKIQLFINYPYLLPVTIAACILWFGAFLSMFLNPDGGPRNAGIRLEDDKAELIADEETGGQKSIKSVGKRVSSYFAKRVVGDHAPVRGSFSSNATGAGAVPLSTPPVLSPTGTTTSRPSGARLHRPSRSSGSAYGYSNRRASSRARSSMRRGSDATILGRRTEAEEPEDEEFMQEEDPNPLGTGTMGMLAARLLRANEEAGAGINDLWLQAAIAQDQESVFEDEDESAEVSEDEDAEHENAVDDDYLSVAGASSAAGISPAGHARASTDASPATHSVRSPNQPSARARQVSRGQLGVEGPDGQHFNRFTQRHTVSGSFAGGRRFSNMSGRVPSIYSHTGLAAVPPIALAHELRSPPAAGSEGQTDPFLSVPPGHTAAASEGPSPSGGAQTLMPITEGTTATFPAATSPGLTETADVAKTVSPLKKLPLFLIALYFLLAVHDTVNGQLFLSFLNTPYNEGGLGLNPAHFATLVAIMCVCQLCYQFYLYPRLGPPRGPFTHLSMFRIGSCLFIPAYLSTPLLRVFASAKEDGGPLVMGSLVLNMACRYAGGTFSYTSVMVLVNAMSPPEVVNLSNGLAQSSVSAARFLGPILGGILWSVSMEGGPSGAAMGFNLVAAFAACAICLSFGLRSG